MLGGLPRPLRLGWHERPERAQHPLTPDRLRIELLCRGNQTRPTSCPAMTSSRLSVQLWLPPGLGGRSAGVREMTRSWSSEATNFSVPLARIIRFLALGEGPPAGKPWRCVDFVQRLDRSATSGAQLRAGFGSLGAARFSLLPRGPHTQTREFRVGGSRRRIAIRFVVLEHVPGYGHQLAGGGHDRHVAVLPAFRACERKLPAGPDAGSRFARPGPTASAPDSNPPW